MLLAAPPILFLTLFFLFPVASILALGAAPDGRLDLAALFAVLARPYVPDIVWFTLWQAALSTLLALLAALPAAYVFARYEFPGKRLVRAAATMPFVLPPVVVGAAFVALLGPRSPVNALAESLGAPGPVVRLDQSLWAVLAAHVFYNYAVVLRVVGGLWSQLDPRPEEAARVLGASGWRAFREVTLPALAPAIASAASLVFLFTFTSFGVLLLLGGPRIVTLEVEIYRQSVQLFDLPAAAALSIVQLVVVLAILLAYARIQERMARGLALRPSREVARRPVGRRPHAVIAGNRRFIATLRGAPRGVLVERSLATGAGYGLASYAGLWQESRAASLLVRPGDSIINSLVVAATSAVIAVTLGLLASAVIARRTDWAGRSLDLLLMLPLGTSAVVVGFGSIVALDTPPLDLRASPLLIPIAHAVIAIPFVVRACVPLLRSVDRRLRDAALTLGASPARAWVEVDLPIVRRAILVGVGFAVAVSLGEFGATLFIARPDVPTLPVAVYRLLGQPGAIPFGQAMALSTLLMLLVGAAVLLLDRAGGADTRGGIA